MTCIAWPGGIRPTGAVCVDFEFKAETGNPVSEVHCMVAKCVVTGHTWRLWGDELKAYPFRGDEIFIAYYASAEMAAFDFLGWPRPRYVLDLFAEFRNLTNGGGTKGGSGLVDALAYFGLPSIAAEEKEAWRKIAIRGGPFTEAERVGLMDYCEGDVDALVRLLPKLLAATNYTWTAFAQALGRGRYMANVAIIERNGIPLDAPLVERFTRHWPGIKRHLIDAVDANFGVYEHGHLRHARLESYLAKHNIPWPRTETGRLALDESTFRAQADRHPQIAPLWELHHTLQDLKLNKLAVGHDGRNRALLSAFRSRTGRNQPSNAKFVFGPAKWIRALIKPGPGRAISYCDWSAQEIAVAAAMSGDGALQEVYDSGDPYISLAILAELAPAGATKDSHKGPRNICKTLFLGVLYGMSAESFAVKAGLNVGHARRLLQLLEVLFPTFWAWAEDNINRVLLGEPIRTVFGWRICYPPGWNIGRLPKRRRRGHNGGPAMDEGVDRYDDEVSVNPRSILNWPMQSNGAEMMRLAASMAVEGGLMICAPVHDAFLLEAPIGEIEEHSARLAAIMVRASGIVLGNGRRCRVDRKIVRYPDRYMDDRGIEMFETVVRLLEEVEQAVEEGSSAADKSSTDCRQIETRCRQNIDPQDTFFSSCYSNSSEKGRFHR